MDSLITVIVAAAAFFAIDSYLILRKLNEISSTLSRLEDIARLHSKVNGLKERAEEIDEDLRRRYSVD